MWIKQCMCQWSQLYCGQPREGVCLFVRLVANIIHLVVSGHIKSNKKPPLQQCFKNGKRFKGLQNPSLEKIGRYCPEIVRDM